MGALVFTLMQETSTVTFVSCDMAYTVFYMVESTHVFIYQVPYYSLTHYDMSMQT